MTAENEHPYLCDVLEPLQTSNVFITGPGGTGKSYLLREVYTALEKKAVVVKCGSTGVAAESIGGITLHSWAGIQLAKNDAAFYNKSIRGNHRLLKRWKKIQYLIIDEISMIGAKLFDLLNDLAKMLRENTQPFGGIRLIICGDMCQLPPVNDEYIFHSRAYRECAFVKVRLSIPWRFMNDIDFFNMLSRIRLGRHTQDDIKLLETRKNAYYAQIHSHIFEEGEIEPTMLYSKHDSVDHINTRRLAELKSQEFHYVCFDKLDKKNVYVNGGKIDTYQQLMDKNVKSELRLKRGAQVMLTRNLDLEKGLCNGSRGVVLECHPDTVVVQFKKCQSVISVAEWTVEDEDYIFTRVQIPLILCWAMTIHKCQSATLDNVVIDCGHSIFSPNMAYVALSRCRNIDGIYLVDLQPNKITCHPDALAYELQDELI